MKNRPLFGLTFTVLIAMVIIAIAPLTIFNIQGFRDFFYSESELYLIESCSLLRNLFPDFDTTDYADIEAFADRASGSTTLRVTIIHEDGTVLADSHNSPADMNNHADRPEIIEALSTGFGSSVRNSATMSNEMMYGAIRITFSNGERGTLRLAHSLTAIEPRIIRITNTTLIICFLALGAAIWISFIVAGRVSKIINRIKITSGHYASGDFSSHLRISSPSDIAEIADDLNAMGEQLKDRIETTEKQKNELSKILDNMAEPVIFADQDLHLLRVNGAAEKLFGITNDSDKGKSILEIFMNSELNSFAENLIREGKVRRKVIFLDRPNPIHLEINGTIIFDVDGKKVSALLLVMHDITRNVKLEQMRKDFVANVSHELKTPVTMIKGYAETLLDSTDSDSGKRNKFLSIIEKHSQRVEAIINDLLFLSGIEKNDTGAQELESIPAIDLLSSSIANCETLAEEKNIKLLLNCDDTILMNVYPLLAEQAVINLVENAIKYSDNDTAVKIRAESAEDGKTCISIEDQGCGIDNDEQDRIFERFYRVDKARSRESGGTGLGLSIVKHIAIMHNGSIDIKSRPGKGSVFTLCI